MTRDADADDTLRSPWERLTAGAPSDSNYHALCVHPVTGRATLAAPSPCIRAGGTFELWAWAGGRWERTHTRLSPARDAEAQGSTVMLFTDSRTHTLRLARVNPGGVLVMLDPDRPDDERRMQHPSLPAHASHTWAWEDPRHGCVWVLTHDTEAMLFKLTDAAIEEVARGPYALGAAFDPVRGEILAVSVTGVTLSRIRVPDGRWEALERPHPRVDALYFDRARDAVCAVEVTSDQRMECLVRGPGGWARRAPPLWVPTYRNGTAPIVDAATGETLVHGGQDFARWGTYTHETFWGREGAMDDTHDAALPRGWSAYGSLLTTEHGLLAVDHQSLRVHRREGARWEPFGRATLDGEAHDNLDCRMLNVAWGDGVLWVLDPDGRLLCWRPEGDVSTTCAPPATEPGAAYARRVAMGWDASTGCFAVFRGDRKRTLYRHRQGAWHVAALPDAPVAGVATGLCTPAGLYVLSRSALHRLQGEAWVKVAPAPPTPSSVLRHDPTRGALLAATQEGVFVWAEGEWRRVATLPEDARPYTVGEGDMELGVDPRCDALVLMNGRALWTLPLATLDLRGCALPTAPWKKSPAKKRGG